MDIRFYLSKQSKMDSLNQADIILAQIHNIFGRNKLVTKIDLNRFNRSTNFESTTYMIRIGTLKGFEVHSSMDKSNNGYMFNICCEDFVLNSREINIKDVEKELSKAFRLRGCFPAFWACNYA
jgi:hypothetical protein